LIPNTAVVALLANPNLPESGRMISDAQEATRGFGQQLLVLNASTPREINAAFTSARRQRAGALYVGGDPFFTSRRQQIVALATRDAIPDMYANREFVVECWLMIYGNVFPEPYRQVGLYVGLVLKGDNPADLPVLQSTKFEFVLNLGTAKALGLEVAPTLLARADEVIE